jgi:uncharacterized membrane protein
MGQISETETVRHHALASVTIARPVHDVFEFYRNLGNLSSFLGDVMSVERIGPSLYRWVVSGPFGVKVRWKVRITELREDSLIRYQTMSHLPTSWTVTFSTMPGQTSTLVEEGITIPFGAVGKVLLAFIGKPPVPEIASNLNRLKQLLETGTITDLSHSVPGKFSRNRAA